MARPSASRSCGKHPMTRRAFSHEHLGSIPPANAEGCDHTHLQIGRRPPERSPSACSEMDARREPCSGFRARRPASMPSARRDSTTSAGSINSSSRHVHAHVYTYVCAHAYLCTCPYARAPTNAHPHASVHMLYPVLHPHCTTRCTLHFRPDGAPYCTLHGTPHRIPHCTTYCTVHSTPYRTLHCTPAVCPALYPVL